MLAGELGAGEIGDRIRRHTALTEHHSGHISVAASRELREWIKLAGLDAGEAAEDAVDPTTWTRQRAAARARILRDWKGGGAGARIP
jgi:hypothetical protein